jgi:hypothetical protein
MNLKNLSQNKILIWAWTSIHDPSGSPAVIANIVSCMQEKDFIYVHGQNYKLTKNLPSNILVKRIRWSEALDYSYRPKLQLFIDLCIKIPMLILACIATIIRYNTNTVITLFYNKNWIVSAYVASRLLNKKLIVYCHDPFSEKYKLGHPITYKVMLYIEKKILSDKAVTVTCLNKGMVNLYSKYRECILLPHINNSSYKPQETYIKNNYFTIGFSGSIYSNNDECIFSLLEATKNIENVKLEFFGNYSNELKDRLLSIREINFSFKTNFDELIASLANCDLLYLPLNFKEVSSMPRECLQYVLPTKSIDYLITGKEILVHCPEDFEVYRFFKEYNCGHLANSTNKDYLKTLIEKIAAREITISQENIKKAISHFEMEKVKLILNEIIK